jgi:8-oxo-dGTP pyrophosphatase MutT (NUDIX family)
VPRPFRLQATASVVRVPDRYRQHVPRPDDATTGDRPPWIELSSQIRASVSIDQVRAAFASPFVADPDPTVRTAVLVPIYERDGEAWMVLTRRSRRLSQNPGDMSFPGGHIEGEETALDAALREANEEVGIDPTVVEVIGELDMIERPRDARHIAPYVGLLAERGTLIPSESEVEAIIDVPLAALVSDGTAWEERWVFEGSARPVRFFAHDVHLGSDIVWGATGRIIWDLLARICETPVPPPVPGEVHPAE